MEYWIGAIIILIFVVFFCINRWYKDRVLLRTVTSIRRGNRAERKLIVKLLKRGIPSMTIFHDLYVEKSPGNFSQIDVVVVTEVGIIVFEVKDYSGWIFGKGYQHNWTQVLAYGKEKHKFYNPVRQNIGHIESLKRRIPGIAQIPIFSVIVFSGKCKLRKVCDLPDDTYVVYLRNVKTVIKRIFRNNSPVIYHNEESMIEILKESVINGTNKEIVRRHIRNVRNYSRQI